MKRKQYKRTYLGRLLILLGIIVVVNYISSFVYHRFDLTTEKRFTISETSGKVLRNLEDEVYIKVYLAGKLPAAFTRMHDAIEELLDEFRIRSHGMVEFEFVDLYGEGNAGISRQMVQQLFDQGLQPTNLQIKEKDGSRSQRIIFPGAVISYRGSDVAVNLLQNNSALNYEVNINNSIQSLEFRFINMIRNLSTDAVEKVAFLEGQGELDRYSTGDITRDLANYYQVDRGRIGGTYGSLDQYKAVIIAKPTRPFSEADKFVIDQYIMNGGKVLWLIDEVSVSMDSLYMGRTFAVYSPLNIEDQLFRYGVRINPNLVKDIQSHVIPVNKGSTGGQSGFQLSPWFYFPVIAPSPNSMITRNLSPVLIRFGSVIDTVGEDPKIHKTVLLSTSPYSMEVDVPAAISLRETDASPLREDFNRSDLTLGVLLEGSFQSDFTNRPVPDGVSSDDGIRVRTLSEPTKMIVISDGDVIRNDVRQATGRPEIGELGVDRYTGQVFGNKDLVLNAMNYLTGQEGLMELRGREFRLRLLDKKRILDEGTRWKVLNTAVPVLLVILFGLLFNYGRRIRYAGKGRGDRPAPERGTGGSTTKQPRP